MEEMNLLIASTNALNFCYGQPQGYEMAMPDHIRATLRETENAPCDSHQYSKTRGDPKLIELVAQLYSRDSGRKIDPSEVQITIGGTGALFSSIMALVKPGDDVIVIEPAFECYKNQISAAGGRLVSVQMKVSQTGNGWFVPMDELEAKLSSKTRMLIFNTPHNPTGKVFSKSELSSIGDLCKKYDVYCLSDEVYDYLVHEDGNHVRIASIDGMWDRTITVGSAGKLFGVTGWRIGWAVAPQELIRKIHPFHVAACDSCPSILQEIVAKSLQTELPLIGTETSYWNVLREKLVRRKTRIYEILESAGLGPTEPQGSYFILCDISAFAKKIRLRPENGKRLDDSVAKWLCMELGVGATPGHCFYSSTTKDSPDKYIRFHFIVAEAVLDELERKLQKIKDFC